MMPKMKEEMKMQGGGKPPRSKPTSFAVVCKDASQMKTVYTKALSQAESLVAVIEGAKDPKFAFALNDQNLGQLKAVIANTTAHLSSFGQEFLVKDLKQLKAAYPPAELEVHLTAFCKLGAFALSVQQMSEKIIKRSSC